MTTTTLVLVLVGFTIVGILLGRMTSTKPVDDFALGERSMGFFPSFWMHWALNVELFRYNRRDRINDKILEMIAFGVLNADMRNKQNQ